MQRLGFSQVHAECDKFPATLSSQWHTHKCQQACFILHPYVALGTAQGSEERGQAEEAVGAAPCRARDTQGGWGHGRIEGLRHLQDKKPLGEQCLCSGCLWPEILQVKDEAIISVAPLLYPVHWSTAAFATSLPSENRRFPYKTSRFLQLTATPKVLAGFVVPTTCLRLRTENKDFSVSHTCKGVLCTPVYGH